MNQLLTLAESVAAHARTQPHKLAVRDGRRTLSYAQWDARATRLAHALRPVGITLTGSSSTRPLMRMTSAFDNAAATDGGGS